MSDLALDGDHTPDGDHMPGGHHVPDGDAMVSLRRYEAIHAHAERELELAGRGELQELVALGERWEELTRDLPSSPPPAAAPLLRRARLVHERTGIELVRLRESLLAQVATTTRAKRAASGYAGQLPQRPQLDRSA